MKKIDEDNTSTDSGYSRKMVAITVVVVRKVITVIVL